MGKRRGAVVLTMLIWVVAAAVWWRAEKSGSMNVAAEGRRSVREEAEIAKQSTARSMQVIKGKYDSWSDWTMGKTAEGLGLNKEIAKEEAQMIMGEAGEAVLKSTKSMHNAASESSQYASHKAREASNLASDKGTDMSSYAKEMAKTAYDTYEDKAASAHEFLYGKGSQVAEMVSDMATRAKQRGKDYYDKYVDKAADAHGYMYGKAGEGKGSKAVLDKASDAKETVEDSMSQGKDRDSAAYDEAKSRVNETYTEAKESMKDQAKQTYEAAKEKVSEAAGTVGAHLRRSGELK